MPTDPLALRARQVSATTYTHGHEPAVVAAHGTRTVSNSAPRLGPRLRGGMAVLDVGCGPQSPAHEIVLGDAAALARRQFAVALGFATGLWALTLAGYGVVMVERGAWVRAALAAVGALP